MAHTAAAVLALATLSNEPASAFPKVLEVIPIHDRLVCVHIDEGYVIHHGLGQKRSDETVVIGPLDVQAASQPGSWSLTVPGRQDWTASRPPLAIGRKSKGTDFAWFVDSWINGIAVNSRPDHTKEHWLYLSLPLALKPGDELRISAPNVSANLADSRLLFNPARSRSESIHVNQLGWSPDAPLKIAYLYHWAGDMGPVSFANSAGRVFSLRDASTGQVVYQGTVEFRMDLDAPETAHSWSNPPFGSFLRTPVWQMDFSDFSTPGKYVVSVDGVGASFPFEIRPRALAPAYYHAARALYHNRSGIALTSPFTQFTRPAPHNPKLTPGFRTKLQYSSLPYSSWGSEGGSASVLEPTLKGHLNAWGWYQDAGDWDSYPTHTRVATELLFAYQCAPENFRDGDLRIPESGNRLPDILDEASWVTRFASRLRRELLTRKMGTGGLSLRVAGDAFGDDGEGRGSWQDTQRTWVVGGEDPVSTMRFAGAAAHLALVLKNAQLTDPEGIAWFSEANACYEWARARTTPEIEDEIRPHRAYAAAALFRLTRQKRYEAQLASDTAHLADWSWVSGEEAWGPMVYCLPGAGVKDPALDAKLRKVVLNAAEEIGIRTPSRRALRWAGNWWMPMLVGQQTTPLALEAAVGWALLRSSDPARARELRRNLIATADYFLGTNSLNTLWMTGLGSRSPEQIFHMDAWYNGKGGFHPGLIPYGMWNKTQTYGEGPWSQFWAYKTVYPEDIDLWPGGEQWFSNRCSPMGSEFTVHQNLAPAAAFYGILAGPDDGLPIVGP